MSKTLVSFLLLLAHEGFSAEIVRLSPHPVRAFQGSDALFQWSLNKHRPARHGFERLIFGIWRNGYLASYIISVTKDGEVIPNPGLRDEFPSLAERVQWKGDLAKSIAAFQISHIQPEDQMDYGLRLEFATLRDSHSDFLSLRVEAERKSAITATLLPQPAVAPGSNTSFLCEFQVGDSDKSVYDGITVGTWKRGGIHMTLLTLTKTNTIIPNPKLDQEMPKHVGRFRAKTSSSKASNTTTLSVEFGDLKQYHEKIYGCRMFFGPFQGSLGASVWVNVEDHSGRLKRRIAEESFEVRVGEFVRLPCQALSEVKQKDGAFKVLYWVYCSSKKCHGEHIKWSWIAGMNRTGFTRVDGKGPYANRMTLFLNGSLEIVNVKPSDETVYRCTVDSRNYTSPSSRFFSIKVDSRENATKADAGACECAAPNSVGSDSSTVIVTTLPTEGSGPTCTPAKEVLESPSPSKCFTGGEVAGIVTGVVLAIPFIMGITFCVWKMKVRHDRQGGITKKAFNGTVPEEGILAAMGPDF